MWVAWVAVRLEATINASSVGLKTGRSDVHPDYRLPDQGSGQAKHLRSQRSGGRWQMLADAGSLAA